MFLIEVKLELMFYFLGLFWKVVFIRIYILVVFKSNFFKGVEDFKYDKVLGKYFRS